MFHASIAVALFVSACRCSTPIVPHVSHDLARSLTPRTLPAPQQQRQQTGEEQLLETPFLCRDRSIWQGRHCDALSIDPRRWYDVCFWRGRTRDDPRLRGQPMLHNRARWSRWTAREYGYCPIGTECRTATQAAYQPQVYCEWLPASLEPCASTNLGTHAGTLIVDVQNEAGARAVPTRQDDPTSLQSSPGNKQHASASGVSSVASKSAADPHREDLPHRTSDCSVSPRGKRPRIEVSASIVVAPVQQDDSTRPSTSSDPGSASSSAQAETGAAIRVHTPEFGPAASEQQYPASICVSTIAGSEATTSASASNCVLDPDDDFEAVLRAFSTDFESQSALPEFDTL